MQANLARSLAGGGKQSENWELIEEVSGITGFQKDYGEFYRRGFTAEPNGTPYHLKAIAVYVYASYTDSSQHQIEQPTAGSAMMPGVRFGIKCDPRTQGDGVVMVLRTTEETKLSTFLCAMNISSITNDPVSEFPEAAPLTGCSPRYIRSSGSTYEPSHVKWRIYAVRA